MMTVLRKDVARWLLRPPYNGVIWLAWAYVIVACLSTGGGPFAGDLVWFDDRVRLVQILDWLNGQGWYDRTIMRVNAPEGFHTIWSRVVDLPVAGLIVAFQSFVGQMQAAMIAAILMPLLLVLLLFYAASYFARPLVGKQNAKLVTLFVLFGSCINPESFTLAGFHVGMIGHHAWYVLLTLMLFGAMARLVLPSDLKHVLIAGFSIGGLLVIGIEGFPLIAGVCGLLAFVGWFQNKPRLIYDGMRLTFLGCLCGLVALPANQPLDSLLTVSFAEPSILGPILIFAAALFFTVQFFILKFYGDKRWLSFAATFIGAGIIAAILIYLFPQILDGGGAALTPEERQVAADEHTEAMSLFKVAINAVDYIRMIAPPLLASGFAFYMLRKTQSERKKTIYLFYFGLVVLTFILASIYSRYFHYMGLAASPWLLLAWLTLTHSLTHDEYRALKSFGVYVALGPLWLWLVPAANFNHSFGSHVLLFPAKLQAEPRRCDTKQITDFLDRSYSQDQTIIVPMYMSDRFLLHTDLHIFFLANFPSHNKFKEAKAFYDTFSPDEAGQIVARRNIDLVAVCKNFYHVTSQSTFTNQLLKGHTKFGQMLVTGQTPDWLKPVEITGATPWLLFEVDRKKLSGTP